MDKLNKLVDKNKERFKYLLLVCAGLAAFNCLTRPDYNMVLYIYVYYVFYHMEDCLENQAREKLNCFYFMCYSLVIDIVWVLFWSGKWSHVENFERTAHIIVVVLSWLGIVLKIINLIVYFIVEGNSIKASLPEKLKEKLNQNQNYSPQKDVV